MKVSQAQISMDVRTLQKRWVAAGLMDLTEAKARELAKIDELERTYWDAWEESKKARQVDTSGKTEGGELRAQIRKETRDGNPAFLTGVGWCIDRRAKLLGLDAPTKQDITSGGKTISVREVVVEIPKETDGANE